MVLEVDYFSEVAVLRLPFPVAPPLVDAFFFSGALYTKGAGVGIVGVMIGFVLEIAFTRDHIGLKCFLSENKK